MHIWTDVLGERPGPASKLLSFCICCGHGREGPLLNFNPSILNQSPATQRNAVYNKQLGTGTGNGKRTDVNT